MVFKNNAVAVDQTEYELKKEDFISIVRDLGLMDKEPLNGDKTQKMMKEAFKIPHDNLLFGEMLEMLLAVTLAYPFSEEGTETSREAKKLMLVLDKLQAKNLTDTEKFKNEIEESRKLKSYVLHFLVPEMESLNNSAKDIGDQEGSEEDEKAEDLEENDEEPN